jgi:pilus assembly protein Flp/PilA
MLKLYVALENALTGLLTRDRDRGATAVEYGLLVGLIALVIITVVLTLGTKIHDIFFSVNSKLSSSVPAS